MNFALSDCRHEGGLTTEIAQELSTVDNDVRSKMNQYNSVKTNLATLQRKQT